MVRSLATSSFKIHNADRNMEQMTLLHIKQRLRSKSNKLQENDSVELKVRLPGPEIMAKLLVAMANNDGGGFIIFGVTDDGTVVGLNKEEHARLPSFICNIVNELTTGIEYKIHSSSVDGKEISIIEVLSSESVAYFSRRRTTPQRIINYRRENLNVITAEKLFYSKLFKYMPLDTFILSLKNKSLRFVESSIWSDQYEQRFYCANYHFSNAEQSAPKIYATCFTSKQNSNAAWRVYSHGTGLGMYCVQLELNVVKLREQLYLSKFQIFEKRVKYEKESIICNIHNPKSSLYEQYFSPFNFDHYLDLLSLKRDAYDFEDEIRIFAKPEPTEKRNIHKNKGEHYDLSISWSEVISKIRVDNKCSLAELHSLQVSLLMSGLNPHLKGKVPDSLPKIDRSIFPIAKDIDVELFDIDYMSGNRHINIY